MRVGKAVDTSLRTDIGFAAESDVPTTPFGNVCSKMTASSYCLTEVTNALMHGASTRYSWGRCNRVTGRSEYCDIARESCLQFRLCGMLCVTRDGRAGKDYSTKEGRTGRTGRKDRKVGQEFRNVIMRHPRSKYLKGKRRKGKAEHAPAVPFDRS